MDDLKLVLIDGSPRVDGNVAAMLREAHSALESRGGRVTVIKPYQSLAGLSTPFCAHCSSKCSGECYAGTQVEEEMELLAAADGILVGSPVYFGTVSAPLKAFWDLTRSLRSSGGLLYTPGGAMAVGGGRYGGQETTIRAIHDIMLVQGMIVVGDSCSGSPGHSGASAQQPVADDERALRDVRNLAEAVAEVASATRGLRCRSD